MNRSYSTQYLANKLAQQTRSRHGKNTRSEAELHVVKQQLADQGDEQAQQWLSRHCKEKHN